MNHLLNPYTSTEDYRDFEKYTLKAPRIVIEKFEDFFFDWIVNRE